MKAKPEKASNIFLKLSHFCHSSDLNIIFSQFNSSFGRCQQFLLLSSVVISTKDIEIDNTESLLREALISLGKSIIQVILFMIDAMDQRLILRL